MTRAIETHRIVLEHMDAKVPSERILPCSMIREGAVCPPSPPHPTWKPSTEDFSKDNARIEAAFMNYVHRANETEEDSYSTVLVCHGNVIRYFVLRALQLPADAWLRTSVANGSITILTIKPSGDASLQCFGDSGFLAPEEVTFN